MKLLRHTFLITATSIQMFLLVDTVLSQGFVRFLGHLDITGESVTDVWGYVDTATNKAYALVGDVSGTGLIIVDVTNPSIPVEVATVRSVPGFDVKAWRHYAYTVTGGGGLGGIVDISDPANPQVVGTFPSSHNIFIAENGYMYSEAPGLRIYDLNQDPTNPTLVWSDGTDDGHDASVIGDRLYDFHGTSATNIYDIADPSNPQLLGSIDDPSIAYHHSGWATEDGKYLFICDELASHPSADITVWDISDVKNPQKVGEFADQSATVHNLYIIDDFSYVSYYTAGFRVLDISDPTQPVLVDEYDTSPESGESFDGAFGVYPFAPSRHIYVSDSDKGLYIFLFPSLLIFAHEPLTDTEDLDGPYTVSVTISAADNSALVPGTAMCVSGLNSDFTDTTYLAPGVKPGEFFGDIPGYGIAGKLTYYIAAQDTAGRWSTEPYGAPPSQYSFDVGPDFVPPQILSMTTLKNTVYFDGTQEISCEVDDNIGILDVRLIWSKNGREADSLKLSAGEEPDHYSGTFTWKGANTGDVFDYFLRVVDSTQNQNTTDSDTFQLEIVSHTAIGDFENKDLSNWETGDGWGFVYPSDVVGWVVNDSPGESYPNNANNSLTLSQPLDLGQFEAAYLRFNTFYVLETDADFGYVEISAGGEEWTALDTVTGDWSYWEGKDEWEHAVIDLTDFLGQDEVYVRFRMTSDDSVTFLGWFVDDIEFWVNRYPLGAEPDLVVVPEEFILLPNYPNPFNPTTTIVYQLPYEAEITLTVYDLLGRAVATLVSSRQEAGRHAIAWDANEVASGVYLCRLAVRQDGALRRVTTQKMTVIK